MRLADLNNLMLELLNPKCCAEFKRRLVSLTLGQRKIKIKFPLKFVYKFENISSEDVSKSMVV